MKSNDLAPSLLKFNRSPGSNSYRINYSQNENRSPSYR